MNVGQIRKLIEDVEDEVEVLIDDNDCFFEVNNLESGVGDLTSIGDKILVLVLRLDRTFHSGEKLN